MLTEVHKDLIDKINKLKKEKNAVILVHNYQRPEIYEVSDFMGDSLELARKAQSTEAKIIVLCGVDFMAESAKILNPEKTVLHPEKISICPMAQMVSKEKVLEMKEKYPNAAVVTYGNSTAEVKAVSDVICTSANAVQITNAMEQDEIIFTIDENLAAYVQANTDKKIYPIKGYCYVHDKITLDQVKQAKANYPNAVLMAHPECRMEILKIADVIASTSQMLRYAKSSDAKEFISVTECGMAEALKREMPDKTFYPLGGTCIQMKKITLQSVYDCLKNNKNPIEIPEEIASKARTALQRMIDLSK